MWQRAILGINPLRIAEGLELGFTFRVDGPYDTWTDLSFNFQIKGSELERMFPHIYTAGLKKVQLSQRQLITLAIRSKGLPDEMVEHIYDAAAQENKFPLVVAQEELVFIEELEKA